MSIFEGVGDDVVYLILSLLIIIILYLAWLSTSVSPSSFTYIVAIDNTLFANILGRLLNTSPGPNDSASNAEQATLDLSETSSNETLGVASHVESVEDGGFDSLNSRSPTSEATVVDSPGIRNEEIHTNETLTEDATDPPEEERSNVSPTTSSPDLDQTEDGRKEVKNNSDIPAGHIRVKLQYIDGKQRTVIAKPEETIGEFKRKNFPQELNSQSVVRFIIGGRELKDENTSLESYNIKHDDVIHCLVSAARPSQSAASSNSASGAERRRNAPDLGSLVFPLFGVALAAVWYARIFYRGYFNGASTFSLVAITFLYGLSLIASYRVGSSNETIGHMHQD